MYIYICICITFAIYFFLFLSTLHGVYTRDCSWNTYLVWRLYVIVRWDKTFVGTLHCALENGADLYVNEGHKIRHYRARSAEERR